MTNFTKKTKAKLILSQITTSLRKLKKSGKSVGFVFKKLLDNCLGKFVFKKVEPIKFLSNDLADDYEEYNEKPIYSFTQSANWTLDSFKSIYE